MAVSFGAIDLTSMVATAPCGWSPSRLRRIYIQGYEEKSPYEQTKLSMMKRWWTTIRDSIVFGRIKMNDYHRGGQCDAE